MIKLISVLNKEVIRLRLQWESSPTCFYRNFDLLPFYTSMIGKYSEGTKFQKKNLAKQLFVVK